MSRSSRSDDGGCVDVEELLQFRERFRDLKKEKDMLRESQSESVELIRHLTKHKLELLMGYWLRVHLSLWIKQILRREKNLQMEENMMLRLELHVKSLTQEHKEDQKHIQKLERELMNCSQEIDYLQDQLNLRDAEVNCLEEQVHILELKLSEMDHMKENVAILREELERSDSERLLLMRESNEAESQMSGLCIEKLEESVSSIALESQCEIEGTILDLMALEQSHLESRKSQDESEQSSVTRLVKHIGVELQDAQKIIRSLDGENKQLRAKVNASEKNASVFCQQIEEWLKTRENMLSKFKNRLSLNDQVMKLPISEQISCGEMLDPLLSKLAMILSPGADMNMNIKSICDQIHVYEILVKQLKEELREEKLKAKEEAEDLTQEMAELRYRLTSMLEEERKRHACIEQVSLQRIAKLEAMVQKEQGKTGNGIRCLPEA